MLVKNNFKGGNILTAEMLVKSNFNGEEKLVKKNNFKGGKHSNCWNVGKKQFHESILIAEMRV